MIRPAALAHADWSVHQAKRWLARAILQASGRYRALPPEPVGTLDDLLARLGGEGRRAAGRRFPDRAAAGVCKMRRDRGLRRISDAVRRRPVARFLYGGAACVRDLRRPAVLPAPCRRQGHGGTPSPPGRPRPGRFGRAAPALRSRDPRPARGIAFVLDARAKSGRQGCDQRLARSAGAGAARRAGPRDLAIPGPARASC